MLAGGNSRLPRAPGAPRAPAPVDPADLGSAEAAAAPGIAPVSGTGATGGVAEEQQEQQKQDDFAYPVKVEDAGPGTKKVSVEIPPERIASKLAEQFKDLRKQAAIPGFRPGHAPQKLVEKMFASDVRSQV